MLLLHDGTEDTAVCFDGSMDCPPQLPCPACGKQHHLSEDGLERYDSHCNGCQIPELITRGEK